MLEDDSALPVQIAFDGADICWQTNIAWKCAGVRRLDGSTIAVGYSIGEWRGEMTWRIFPAERMIRRSLSFEWTGESPAKLHGIELFNGKMPCRSDAGRYLFPGRFPPFSRAIPGFSDGRVEEGSAYTPMVVGDNGRNSVMMGVNELVPYSDFSRQRVIERPDGFSLTTCFESAGWIRRGSTQKVGDVWLVFRDGTAEEHLLHTDEWFRKVGMVPPHDRPDWLKGTVLYSMHPCGRSEEGRVDKDGLALSRSYLPYLEALGVNCVWMRPVEDEAPYIPRDYYAFQKRVGDGSDLKAYVAAAHLHGMKVWRDAVVHGGRDDSPRAKAHPEWLGWKEDGKPDKIWTYDYYYPTWVSAFSNIVEDITREYDLDGWRIDVADGSRFPNWNPGVPYPRGSYARCQGGLAQQRAIRAAARRASPDAATLGETVNASSACVSDSIYDFKPNLEWSYRFTDTETADCVRNIGRFLHEQQSALPPDTILMHYGENHDSLSASLMHGRAAANAMFAMTAWIKGCPLIYQETEDGCFEEYRRILCIRNEVDELTRGECDYGSISAPDGVFACLRTSSVGTSVVLVNFNGRRTRGVVSWQGGAVDVDLAPFGYEVRRVHGSPLPDFSVPAWEPRHACVGGALSVEVRRRDGRKIDVPCRIEREEIGGGMRYRVSDLPGMKASDVELVVRMPDARRWFAHSADGDFDSPFVVRHPSWNKSRSSIYHSEQEGAVRWRSSLHPLGFTKNRACIGGICGEKAYRVSGIDAQHAEAVVLDRIGDEKGLAVAIRGSDMSALAADVETMAADDISANSDSLTGLSELTAVMSGWEWESGDLKVRVQRNGCLRGVWRRNGDSWERLVDNALVVTDTGVGRRDVFGNPGKRECKQSEEIDCPMSFWKDRDGTVHLDFGPGDLRPFGRNGKMASPIWYRAHYSFRPGETSFRFESGVSVERAFEVGEGEVALRVRLSPGIEDWEKCMSELGSEGSPATVVAEGRTRRFRWVTPEKRFSEPRGSWHGITMQIGF